MSINKVIKVTDTEAAIKATQAAEKVMSDHEIDDADLPAIDKSNANTTENEDHSGRKYKSEIDGPEQASQETDEIYADPRQSAGLPPAGKNVGELTAHDLTRHDKD